MSNVIYLFNIMCKKNLQLLQRMRSGLVIGLPFSILQFGVHQHISPELVTQNFLLCSAIYDADRFTPETPLLSRLVSRSSAIAATSLYAFDPHLRPLSPLIPILHLWYTPLKSYLAPVKPFFVSFLWCVLVCYVPPYGTDVSATALSLFLNIAALSHAVDVLDLDEDREAGVITPAVSMGTETAIQYAFALQLASILVDTTTSTQPHLLYDALSLVTLIGIVTRRSTESALVGTLFVAAYVSTHDLELIMTLLTSSEVTHKMAISAALDLTQCALLLDEPYRSRAIDVIFRVINTGDEVGSSILDLFETALRNRIR